MENVSDVLLEDIDPSPYQPRHKIEGIERLAQSIADVGLVNPITVRPKAGRYELVAGERRWRASKHLGLTHITAIIRELTDSQARRIAYEENVQRDDLSRIEEVEGWIGHLDAQLWQDQEYRDCAEMNGWGEESNKLHERQRARWLLIKLDSDRRHGTDNFANKFIGKVEAIFATHHRRIGWQSFLINDVPLLDLPEPVKEIAIEKNLNKSQARELGRLAKEESEESREILETGLVTIRDGLCYEKVPIEDASAREIKKAPVLDRQRKQSEEREQTRVNVLDPGSLDGQYRTIVIDPPWPMQKILREVRPNQGLFDYPTMTLDEIAKLPISDLALPDGCHVYLWTTNKYLPHAFDLFETWGIRYQCLLTWCKNVGPTPFSWMYDTEHVLFGRIGTLELQKMGLRLSFEADVVGHSVKPDIFYDRVLCASPAPRLELFARKERKGFKAWGNEI